MKIYVFMCHITGVSLSPYSEYYHTQWWDTDIEGMNGLEEGVGEDFVCGLAWECRATSFATSSALLETAIGTFVV